ncbi:hypothetical protein [Butyrivibrio sp. AC2005]|uniref:hypothetical protein n=1 Tax=Butyrivibrio sp. AC2005 TaxID=1280672 RepID=UPI0012DE4E2D|nr:hypothetical protein [Butyrivibrio sp. AC2005]
MDGKKSVSYIAYESEMVRQERINRRLWFLSIITLMVLLLTNSLWILKVVM